MTNKPTIEIMSEVIGVFMGGFWKEFKSGNFRQRRFYYKDEAFAWVKSPENINYHKEWNELMPVVERIEAMDNRRYGFAIEPTSVIVSDFDRKEGEEQIVFVHEYPDNGDTKLSMTYDAVYQFITWLNQQKQKDGTE